LPVFVTFLASASKYRSISHLPYNTLGRQTPVFSIAAIDAAIALLHVARLGSSPSMSRAFAPSIPEHLR
jgi:hypothetical protein